MLNDATSFKAVYIVCGYTDLRAGMDRLAALVETQSGSGIQQGLSVSVNGFSIHVTESTPMPLLAAVLGVVRDAQ